MAEVIFKLNGINTMIQCNFYDKMKDIINTFIRKTQKENAKLIFKYNGDLINKELSFQQNAKESDLKAKKMEILVEEGESIDNKKNNKIKSKEVICPDCGENILIKLKDNKINLYECKNGHFKNNILYEEYENIQKIDLSNIKCDYCKSITRNNTFNNEFYICNTCKMQLCPLCKSSHEKKHNIINYDDKNCICRKHSVNYLKYCKNCKENMCMLCENEHENHDIIYLGNIIINKDDLIKENDELRKIIDELKNNIIEIKKVLDKIFNNLENYYNINKDIISNYDNNKINFYILKNLNEINNYNKNLIKDLNNIIKETDIKKKVDYLMYIYNNNNYVYRTEIYENGDKYIGEFKNNKRNGKGIMYYNKNDEKKREKYEGEWKDGNKEGKGILYWRDGDKYEGDFKLDITEGKGTYYANNGDKYVGDFKNGKSNGKGIQYWNNGNRYEGDFKNDKIEGKGVIYYKNGDRKMGDYLNGVPILVHAILTVDGNVTHKEYL